MKKTNLINVTQLEWRTNTWYKDGQLEELRLSHFTRQLRQKSCINKANYFFSLRSASCSCAW